MGSSPVVRFGKTMRLGGGLARVGRSIAAWKYKSGRDSGETPRMDIRRGEEAPEDRTSVRDASGSGSVSRCGVVRFELFDASSVFSDSEASEAEGSITASSFSMILTISV